MKMVKMFLAALALCAVLMPAAGRAEAKQFRLENASGVKVSVALVVPTRNGWWVQGWYVLNPYSYKTVNISAAGGNVFGYYAMSGNLQWAGRGNDPAVCVINRSMGHRVNERPYGPNQRMVKIKMKQGNSVRFEYKAPQQSRTTGWW